MPGALAPQRVSRGPEVPGAGNAASLGSAASGGGRKEPVISRPTPGVARPTSVAPASTAAAAAPCRLIPPPPSLADSEEIGCGERYRRGRGWMRRPAAGLLGRLLVCDPARRLSAVDAIRRVAALSSAAPSPWRGRRRGRASGRQVCRRGVRVPQRVRGRGGSLAGLLLVQLAGGGIEGSAPLRAALPTSCCSRARRLNAGGGGLGCLVCRARPSPRRGWLHRSCIGAGQEGTPACLHLSDSEPLQHVASLPAASPAALAAVPLPGAVTLARPPAPWPALAQDPWSTVLMWRSGRRSQLKSWRKIAGNGLNMIDG